MDKSVGIFKSCETTVWLQPQWYDEDKASKNNHLRVEPS
ncbi:hypothetical protein PLAN_30491 [Planktothrix rubescens CCAP 1459/22]|uniref:Uncharacterized protein n=1 Tax=Planktothrix rubescens CCAP 1459/22 TaxID=329571 RepID=A0A6J7ZMR9_PLARU|nr:hypothetical protein PLAN_30491 [Planktothrix rubescens NIVA-CYA 18]